MHEPEDLVPLPTTPYDQRPISLPLTVEEARTAIWRSAGNITRAAEKLKVSSSRLRAFVAVSPLLTRECQEAREMLVDKAEEVAADALRDPERADSMARFILSTQGKKRGWGTGIANVGSVTNNVTNNIVQWADGTQIAVPARQDAKQIEGEVIDG